MLSPQDIQAIANDVTDIYSGVETACIKSIVRRIQAGKPITQASLWQMKKLGDVGLLRRELIAEIKKETRLAYPEIERLINTAVKNSRSADMLRLEGLKTYKGKTKEELLKALATSPAMASTIKKLTASARSAINLTNTKAVQGACLAYTQAVNRAYLSMATGNLTREEAIKEAVKAVGESGIKIVDRKEKISDAELLRKNGEMFTTYRESDAIRVYPLDSAIRRDLVTTVNQASADLTLKDCSELGTHLVETSWHNGSRPEHEVWQGKVFSLDPKDERYGYFYGPLEAGLPAYGDVAGICGINCRHSFFPYFEGSEKATDRGKKDAEENAQQYANEQQQRAYERRLRSLKRQQVALLEGGYTEDAQKVQRLINSTGSNYRQFLKETGLKRVSMLERVEGYKRISVPKVPAPTPTPTPTPTAPKGASAKYTPYARDDNSPLAKMFGKQAYDLYVQELDAVGNTNLSNAYKKVEGIEFQKTTSKTMAYYNSTHNYIKLNPREVIKGSSYEEPMQTLFHEMGHALDYAITNAGASRMRTFSVSWQEGRFYKTVTQESRGLIGKLGRSGLEELIRGKDMKVWASFSDIIEGSSNALVRLGFGHGRRYWETDKYRVASEAWAELCEGMITNKASYQFLKDNLPKTVACFEEMLADLI